MTEPVRLAIAVEHALFREGLKCIFEKQPGFVVVATTDRLDELDALLARVRADALLLDLHMGPGTLSKIRALSAQLPLVVLTASEHPDTAALIYHGARAVVSKRFEPPTLVEAIHAVRAGNVWLPDEMRGRLMAMLQGTTPTLTAREWEIVRYVGLGMRNAEVGRRLFITEETVKTHLGNIFRKLGVRDRVELALYAIRVGIIGGQEYDAAGGAPAGTGRASGCA